MWKEVDMYIPTLLSTDQEVSGSHKLIISSLFV